MYPYPELHWGQNKLDDNRNGLADQIIIIHDSDEAKILTHLMTLIFITMMTLVDSKNHHTPHMIHVLTKRRILAHVLTAQITNTSELSAHRFITLVDISYLHVDHVDRAKIYEDTCCQHVNTK